MDAYNKWNKWSSALNSTKRDVSRLNIVDDDAEEPSST